MTNDRKAADGEKFIQLLLVLSERGKLDWITRQDGCQTEVQGYEIIVSHTVEFDHGGYNLVVQHGGRQLWSTRFDSSFFTTLRELYQLATAQGEHTMKALREFLAALKY
jgi:hypothetical protein